MMIGGRDMTPPRAAAALEDLLALSKAVSSGTLEKDAKAFLDAAKKAKAQEEAAMARDIASKEREQAVEKREKAILSREKALAKGKSDLKAERSEWEKKKETEEQKLADERTKNAVAAAAVKERSDKAEATLRDAHAEAEKAKKTMDEALRVKADFESRMRKLKEIA